MSLHWPQITVLVMAFLALFIHAAKNGTAMDREYNFPVMFMGTVFNLWLLWCGGFFG